MGGRGEDNMERVGLLCLSGRENNTGLFNIRDVIQRYVIRFRVGSQDRDGDRDRHQGQGQGQGRRQGTRTRTGTRTKTKDKKDTKKNINTNTMLMH